MAWDVLSRDVLSYILKFYHKVIPSKDADRNVNSFNPDQAFLFRPALFAQKNRRVATGCGSYD